MLTKASELTPGQRFSVNIINAQLIYTVASVQIVENGRFPVKVNYSESHFASDGKWAGRGALYFKLTDHVILER